MAVKVQHLEMANLRPLPMMMEKKRSITRLRLVSKSGEPFKRQQSDCRRWLTGRAIKTQRLRVDEVHTPADLQNMVRRKQARRWECECAVSNL